MPSLTASPFLLLIIAATIAEWATAAIFLWHDRWAQATYLRIIGADLASKASASILSGLSGMLLFAIGTILYGERAISAQAANDIMLYGTVIIGGAAYLFIRTLLFHRAATWIWKKAITLNLLMLFVSLSVMFAGMRYIP